MASKLMLKLVADYPAIFVHYENKQSGFPIGWGIDIDDGWYNIVNRLCHTIQHDYESEVLQRNWHVENNAMVKAAQAGDWSLFDKRFENLGAGYRENKKLEVSLERIKRLPKVPKQPVAVQVKEKFGGLRFYTRSASAFAHGAISFAESISFSTCDVCGGVGKVGNQDIPMNSKKKTGGYYATRCAQHWGRLQENGAYRYGKP